MIAFIKYLEGTTEMAEMTFSIWRLVVENNDAGLMSKLANRDTFAKLITTTIDPIRIHPNDKEAFSVSIKNTNDYIFWMIEHGNTQPRDETVYDAETKRTRKNPRTKKELEFMEQFFALYDYDRELFFISVLRKRGIFKKILKQLDDNLDVDIRGIYVNEEEFISKLKTLSEVRFTTTNDIFSTDSDSKNSLEKLIGGKPENDVIFSVEYKQEPIQQFKSFLKKLRKERENFQIKGLLIRGTDSTGFERLLNQDEFIKKIKLKDIDKEENGKFSFEYILKKILSEIERLSDDLVK